MAVNLDQKQPGFPEHILPAYLEQLGVEYKIVEENTYGIVKEKNPGRQKPLAHCVLVCVAAFSTVRRPNWARPKIALGHHRDDIPADAVPQYVLRRQNERYAAEADER